jgi:hypothetical protein
MNMKWMLSVGLAAMSVNPFSSIAAPLTVIRPEPGLECMLLDDQDLAATQQSQLPPIRSAPSTSSTVIGYPSEIVFVRVPLQEQDGFVAVVKLNGEPGWIEADKLQPWHAMNGRPGRCIPSLMSNGFLGSDIQH